MLLVHWARRAASRAACTAGNKSAINTAMIAITTRSSISVKPRRPVREQLFIWKSLAQGIEKKHKPGRESIPRETSRPNVNDLVQRMKTVDTSLHDTSE